MVVTPFESVTFYQIDCIRQYAEKNIDLSSEKKDRKVIIVKTYAVYIVHIIHCHQATIHAKIKSTKLLIDQKFIAL